MKKRKHGWKWSLNQQGPRGQRRLVLSLLSFLLQKEKLVWKSAATQHYCLEEKHRISHGDDRDKKINFAADSEKIGRESEARFCHAANWFINKICVSALSKSVVWKSLENTNMGVKNSKSSMDINGFGL